ncbi:uncharacterized protein Z520_08240 [Fonsecaea multimorphosa CBS 102226]|uniref:Glycosyl transferase family 25 domain-containing protein n=1 Tax=Fonsecaea multimorphosa CBS 102226 TaxID=1442371 RepID=A0A0D2H2B6_9EURO|nr:uncharacterized protein Z520_08240 [Fonsecaea multimorphosa CBS 102226]KIX95985.1 hypothetical protein Z520_08240 [Fonsecaea multimorphosa CBS 102226]OAL21755.1 hypothetical protein AYO22_07697 [Fonsecaea multimorphosa]
MLLAAPTRLNFIVVGLVITTFILFYSSFRSPRPEEQDVLDFSDADADTARTILESSPEHPPARTTHATETTHQFLSDDITSRVQNQTLGFQEIYMISLPDRSDKQDAFAMQAAFSDISYKQVDGVYGHDVPVKALPHTMGQESNVIGCWRAHVNVYQRMVHEGISSALIFEDDADWDVSLKEQLVQFAQGSRFITNTSDDAFPHSPYGHDWDILWIGHCGTWVYPEDSRRFFVIPDDLTVQPPEARVDNVDQPDMSHWESGPHGNNRTRIVFHSEGGVCTAAYAISQKGARKALYHLSMVPYNSPVDWGLAGLCKNKEYDFTCVSPWPQLVGVSRPTANTAKWSDIGYGPDSERVVEQGRSLHLVYPVRQNILNFLHGKTIFNSLYPDIAPPMSIKEIGKAVGHTEILEFSVGPFQKPPEEG